MYYNKNCCMYRQKLEFVKDRQGVSQHSEVYLQIFNNIYVSFTFMLDLSSLSRSHLLVQLYDQEVT